MHVVLTRGPLVSTKRAFNNEATPAIGLASLAGYLRGKGIRVTLFDPIAEGLNRLSPAPGFDGYVCQGLSFDEILERIPGDTDVLGFSVMFSGEWPVQRELIKRLRARLPNALFVAGGEHITALTEFVLRDCPALDLCVRGEGERAIADIVARRVAGDDPREVDGIGYLDAEGRYVEKGGLTRIVEVDTIPWPYWPDGYLEKFWSAGKSFGVQFGRDMPINVSRGCPYRCTFCSSPQMWTTRYVLRDVDDVVAEIEHYIHTYKIDSLQFYDLTAITKKRWTVEFCRKLIERGVRLRWSLPSGTRSEALDEETLGLLREAGCSYLVYAPESGSPRTLERIKKRISLPDLTKSVLTARRLGIVVRTNLIIGFPGETRRDMFETIRYGLKLAFRGVDEVPINIFSPYPGSELFANLRAAGRVTLDDRYFLSLNAINTDYTSMNPMTVNESVSVRRLALYRLFAMMSNYLIGYLVYPTRIWRTLRNVYGGGAAATTVFEHRLKDARKRAMVASEPAKT
jgi:radical SAM superfamily enzyme YgiQ (UPF0313 family)